MVVIPQIDGEIPAGGKISKEIKEQLSKSDVVFLLITPNYVASTWCYEKEMEYALKRNEKGECIVIPVIIKKIVAGEYPFNDLKFVPTDGRAVTSFRSHDDGFLDAFNAIKAILQDFYEYSRAVKPPIRQTGNRLSGLTETADASLLA